jgi:hypothetical protein
LLHGVARAGIDEHARAVALEQEIVDRDEERAVGGCSDQCLRLSALHAEDEIERGLQDAIAEALQLEAAATKYLRHRQFRINARGSIRNLRAPV